MKNFLCPNCNSEASMKNLVENKKLKDNIVWYKKMLLAENLPIYRTSDPPKQQPIAPQTSQSHLSLITQTESHTHIPHTLFENEKSASQNNPSNDLRINQLDKSKQEMNPEEKLQFYDTLKDNKKKSDEDKSTHSHPEQSQPSTHIEQNHPSDTRQTDPMKMVPNMRPQDYMMYMQAMQSISITK